MCYKIKVSTILNNIKCIEYFKTVKILCVALKIKLKK